MEQTEGEMGVVGIGFYQPNGNSPQTDSLATAQKTTLMHIFQDIISFQRTCAKADLGKSPKLDW